MIPTATVSFLKVFSEYLTQNFPETPEVSTFGKNGQQQCFPKILFVVKLRKTISPSLLTRFYPRFRPRLRLGMYFLNIWPKIISHLLIFPRFTFKDSRLCILVKTWFSSYYLVQKCHKQLPIILKLTIYFLKVSRVLNIIIHVDLTRI